MSLNHKEIDRILEELDLEGAFIQKIRQSDYFSLLLDTYKPHTPKTILVHLGQQQMRIHSCNYKYPVGIKLQRFPQILRSKIKGGRISSVKQVDNERIIQVDIQKGKDIYYLYIRLWGGAGNIILTDNNQCILDSYFRRPKRNEISGQLFSLETTRTQAKKEFFIRDYDTKIQFNMFIEQYYKNFDTDNTAATIKTKLQKHYIDRIEMLNSAIAKIKSQLKKTDEAEYWEQLGQILIANLHQEPGKQGSIVLDNFYDNMNPVEVKLSEGKSLQDNAEAYFARSKKLKRSMKHLQDDLDNKTEILNEEINNLSLIENCEDLSTLKKFDSTISHTENREDKANIPGLQFWSHTFKIFVGRSSKENDALLRKYVKGNDYWMHIRDFPGSYVFIKSQSGKSIPLETLLDAGNLAVFYSKGRSGGSAELYYTQVKYLRRAKGAKQGTVLPTQEKNISIALDQKRLDRLLTRKPS